MNGYVDVAGGKLYYEVDGSSPPLTLIHAGVAHLRMWDAQVSAWRERFRVIRYDCRGFGRTRVEDVPYSNRDDLRRLLDHLGVDQTHLLGISRGSIIATDFLVEQPARVTSLVWVAGGVRGFEVEDDPRLKEVWPELERLEQAHDWDALVELETQIWTDGPGQPADRVEPALRRQMIEWNLENYRAEQQANQPIPTEVVAAERLGDVRVPVLAMWGTLDETSVAECGELLVKALPQAKRHVFEGVAHMVNLERPAQFNQLVADFVAQAEAAGTAAWSHT